MRLQASVNFMHQEICMQSFIPYIQKLGFAHRDHGHVAVLEFDGCPGNLALAQRPNSKPLGCFVKSERDGIHSKTYANLWPQMPRPPRNHVRTAEKHTQMGPIYHLRSHWRGQTPCSSWQTGKALQESVMCVLMILRRLTPVPSLKFQ